MAASGLPVGSICGNYEGPIIHPDPAERESRLADVVRTLEFADAIGARGVIRCAGLLAHRSMPEMSPPMPDHVALSPMKTRSSRNCCLALLAEVD